VFRGIDIEFLVLELRQSLLLTLLVLLSHQWYDNLAIGVSLEVVWMLEGFSNDPVVVNFPIDSKSNALICISEWLGSGVNPDNT
jgi:hypothetical protein